MAEVAVDVDTGIVRVETMVAVQDCGLVVDRKTAESQVYGGLIMGISYALTEEKVLDPATGRLLNPDMEFYKIPGIADVGELIVHMVTGKGHDERGVIGLGEPPVISPGAAISNAVANAVASGSRACRSRPIGCSRRSRRRRRRCADDAPVRIRTPVDDRRGDRSPDARGGAARGRDRPPLAREVKPD